MVIIGGGGSSPSSWLDLSETADITDPPTDIRRLINRDTGLAVRDENGDETSLATADGVDTSIATAASTIVAAYGFRPIVGERYDGNYPKTTAVAMTQGRPSFLLIQDLRPGFMFDALWVDIEVGAVASTVQLSAFADDGYGRPGTLLAQTAALPSVNNNEVLSGTFTAVACPTNGIYIAVHCTTVATPSPRRLAGTQNSRAHTNPASTAQTYTWTTSAVEMGALASNPSLVRSQSGGGSAAYPARCGFRGA